MNHGSLDDSHSVARNFHPTNVKIRVLKSPKRFKNESSIKVQHLHGLTREEVFSGELKCSHLIKYRQFETSRYVAFAIFFPNIIFSFILSGIIFYESFSFHKKNCVKTLSFTSVPLK